MDAMQTLGTTTLSILYQPFPSCKVEKLFSRPHSHRLSSFGVMTEAPKHRSLEIGL